MVLIFHELITQLKGGSIGEKETLLYWILISELNTNISAEVHSAFTAEILDDGVLKYVIFLMCM
jgi:hypothetical protein